MTSTRPAIVVEPARQRAVGDVKVGGLSYGVLALLADEARVDDQGHPIAGDDVMDVRATRGQLGESLPGRSKDAAEEVRICEIVGLTLPLSHGEAQEVLR